MNKDALYYGSISHFFFYAAEIIGMIVGMLIHFSWVSVVCVVLSLLLYAAVHVVHKKDKAEGKIYPKLMCYVSVCIAVFLGYTYESTALALLALMVNITLLSFFQEKKLYVHFGVFAAVVVAALGIFSFPFLGEDMPTERIVIIIVTVLLCSWLFYNSTIQMDFLKRKTTEQEKSLDDLLKIVEAKRVETRNYSVELEGYKKNLEQRVSEQTEEIRIKSKQIMDMQQNAIEGMATLIESRDGNTGEHVRNTRTYVMMLVNYLYEHNMHPEIVDADFVGEMILASPLHDVGKIEISDVILNKPGKFTPEEYEIMKTHAALGGECVRRVLGKDADPELLEIASDVAHYHHEKYDGTGYPEKLKGEEIPFSARIMAIADVFDALVSKRVYKERMSIDEAYRILDEDSGKHFDPELVEVFKIIRPQVEEYALSKE